MRYSSQTRGSMMRSSIPGAGLCAIAFALSLVVPGLSAQSSGHSGPDDDAHVSIQPRVKLTSDAAAEQQAELDRRRATLRVDSSLVLVNVAVTDAMNHSVTGLERNHFRLFEDKMEQKITHFTSEDAPVSVGLIFDRSGSMGSKLSKSRQAAAQFFKAANP